MRIGVTGRGRLQVVIVILKGGWHFSFQGGPKTVSEKLADHQWHSSVTDVMSNLESLLHGRKDIIRNPDRRRAVRFRITTRGLPEYILKNKEKYQSFFYE